MAGVALVLLASQLAALASCAPRSSFSSTSSETSYFTRQVRNGDKSASQSAAAGAFASVHQRGDQAPLVWTDHYETSTESGHLELLNEPVGSLADEQHFEHENKLDAEPESLPVERELASSALAAASLDAGQTASSASAVAAASASASASDHDGLQQVAPPDYSPAELDEPDEHEQHQLDLDYPHFNFDRWGSVSSHAGLAPQHAGAWAAASADSFQSPLEQAQHEHEVEEAVAKLPATMRQRIKPWLSNKLEMLAPFSSRLRRTSSRLKQKPSDALDLHVSAFTEAY